MATSPRLKAVHGGHGARAAGYVQPGRVDKKPLVGYFDKDAHKAIKQLALDLDRKIEDLLAEALHDLLIKCGRIPQAKLFGSERATHAAAGKKERGTA